MKISLKDSQELCKSYNTDKNPVESKSFHMFCIRLRDSGIHCWRFKDLRVGHFGGWAPDAAADSPPEDCDLPEAGYHS